MSFEASRSVLASMQRGFKSGTLSETLSAIFSQKSTATLQSRVSPMVRFVQYCGRNSRQAFPVDEAVVYEYLVDESQRCAPTYMKSFLSSLAFCHFVLGLAGAEGSFKSQRVRGLATQSFLEKRKTTQRLPLLHGEVLRLEKIVTGEIGASIQDRHAAGCFLFMVYARARFSDMMNVESIKLDVVEVDGQVRGFIETEVGRSKTSFSLERKVKFLPMTATVQGLLDKPWGVSWSAVIPEAGIEVASDKPLLPGRTTRGWHTLPLSAEGGTAWLRSLLGTGPRTPGIGTHSCKSTCLSWLAKWGVDDDTRRILGYHVLDKRSTMLIYGRDNTSHGLRVLQEVVDAIRRRKFNPDLTRSGMFLECPDNSVDANRKDSGEKQISSSSEDSGDEEFREHERVEEAEAEVVGPLNAEFKWTPSQTKQSSSGTPFRESSTSLRMNQEPDWRVAGTSQ